MDQRRHHNPKVLLTIAALGSALVGCEGEDVLVGTARESLHLNVCMGAHTDCEPELDAQPLVMPEARTCEATLGPELEPEFMIRISQLACTGAASECVGPAQNLAVSADGTSWVLTSDVGNPWDASGVWLLRISAEGELLSMLDAMHGMVAPLNHSVRQERALALDERGHAFALIYEQDGGSNADAPIVERSWLTEYDANGEVANGPSLITGIGNPRLALASDGKVLIAANGELNARYGVLAAVDAEGELLWSQNGVRTRGQGDGYGVVGLAVTDHGPFVMADRGRSSADFIAYGVTRYDADGNAIWDRLFDPLFTWATLVGTGDHQLFVAATQDHTLNKMGSWTGRLDESGAVDWIYDIPGQGYNGSDNPVAIDVNRDVALTSRGSLGAQAELIEIALDGESCRRHAISEVLNTVNRVAIDGTGAVVLMSDYYLARVRLPEE